MELRILQIDLARQKENIPFIKSYIDFGCDAGYNAILIYLENAVRTSKTEFFDKEETYSLEEMKEIVNYIHEKKMIAIPAFENLGHLEKFFLYPELKKYSEAYDGSVGRGYEFAAGICSVGCTSNEEFYQFFEEYFKEILSIFPDKYVHMGLDEPFDFAICKKCNERIKNGETKANLFYEHIMRTYNFVKSLGKTMMMWDDFFEYANIYEKLPRDIIMCNWNYNYIGNELAGHWTNRIKDDRLRIYDKLGFRYIFCVYGSKTSSAYNLESMTDYAMKYHPMGAIMTMWEKSASFYFSAYPQIAHAGALWSDKIKTRDDIIDIYEKYIGDRKVSEAIYDLEVVAYFGHTNVDKMYENDSLILRVYRDSLRHFVNEIKPVATNTKSDVLIDIFNQIFDQYNRIELEYLGKDIFNYYETSLGKDKILNKLDEIESNFEFISNKAHELWNKYRYDIKSTRNSFESFHNGRKQSVKNIRESLNKNEKKGILYFDTMLHDGYCTVHGEIRVKYLGEKDEISIYNGGIKNNTVAFEVGGCYGFSFAIENKEIEYVIVSIYAEGALYPLNLRYFYNGEKYIASKVEKLCGNVKNEDLILLNDTQFAEMGYNDGIEHFNNLELSKKRSEIKVYFKKLI